MDSPTTVLMATGVGVAALGGRTGAAGPVVMGVGALLPDLDALFFSDTLQYVSLHRGPSHSIFFALAAAPVLAGAAKLLRARASFAALSGLAFLGIAFAIATDLATWWGTVVFWPIDTTRFGVGIVFIIDLFLFAIAVSPFVAWGVAKLRGGTLPWRAFRIAAILIPVWFGVCVTGRLVALDVLGEQEGRPVDVFPQPFSPLRWSLATDLGDAYRISFVDLLGGREIVETRTFPKGEGGPAEITDATEEARTLLWFYRLPVREVRELPDGRTEVLYRDLAYESRPTLGREPPFRYRFVLEDDRIVERGFPGRD